MRSTSRDCDQGKHGECDGNVQIMDQDGPNWYVCQCGCHPQHKVKTCETCGGRGTVGYVQPPMFGPRVKATSAAVSPLTDAPKEQ